MIVAHKLMELGIYEKIGGILFHVESGYKFQHVMLLSTFLDIGS